MRLLATESQNRQLRPVQSFAALNHCATQLMGDSCGHVDASHSAQREFIAEANYVDARWDPPPALIRRQTRPAAIVCTT